VIHDPRDLKKELEEQGSQVEQKKDQNGKSLYWVTLPDGQSYGLSVEDLSELKNIGKLNPAGIREHG
jgi:hypothetical protein